MISPIGKIGARSSGPAGCIVPGWSGGRGSPGRSGSRLTQWVGISASGSRYLVVSWLMLAPGCPGWLGADPTGTDPAPRGGSAPPPPARPRSVTWRPAPRIRTTGWRPSLRRAASRRPRRAHRRSRSRSRAARARGRRVRPRQSSSGRSPAQPIATSHWPFRHARPNESVMRTPGAAPVSSRRRPRSARAERVGVGRKHHDLALGRPRWRRRRRRWHR